MTLKPNLLRGERVYLSAVQDDDLEVVSDWTENSDLCASTTVAPPCRRPSPT